MSGTIVILFVICFTSICAFLSFRIFLNGVVSYVLGQKQYKQDIKKLSVLERIFYSQYREILPNWIIVMYIIQMVAIVLLFAMYLIMKFVLVHTSFIMLMLFFSLVIYIVFTPIFIRVFSINWRIGTILDYSKIVDKYAIRKKLYPELYQDEDE